jgi:transposase-like protein
MITDKLASYGAAKQELMPGVEHRRHKGLVWGSLSQASSSIQCSLLAGRRVEMLVAR